MAWKMRIKSLIDKINIFINIQRLKARKVVMGDNCRIRGIPHIYVAGELEIGDDVSVNSSLRSNPIGGDRKTIIRVYKGACVCIGNGVGISNSCIVARKKILIGDNVLIGGGCKIYDNDFHPLEYEKRREKDESAIRSEEVVIGDGVFVGAHCILLKGTRIGERSIIGAGSVVSGEIPADEVWAGNPARFIRKV